MKATVSKQETLVYALAAAGVVIVVLLGTVIYLIGAKDDTGGFSDVPTAPGVGTEQQTAPPLTEEQINQSSGELPSGHPGVGGAPGASTGGAPAGEAPAAGEEAPAGEEKPKATK